MANGLTPSQLVAISNIERACSALSLIGCLFVIATFCFFDEFHKPINRLVFYASFGNMITNVGTLMSRMYVESPASAGCQVQSFLIQMFMPADAFWTLAMAINVYLTFYYRFDARGLRKMELPYILCCYGVPFIPALTYLFMKNSKGDMVYGDAVLWCWVTVEWNILRILTFYGPVWILILITFFIYIRAGRTIYQKRKQLDNVISSDADPLSVNREPVGIMKTTEVTTTEASPTEGANAFSLQNTRREGPDGYVGEYAVTVAADGRKPTYPSDEPSMLRVPSTQPPKNASKSRRTANASRRKDYEVNNAAWAYTKCAILFFTALLITWIPSSANRVYSFANPEKTLPPLEFMSAFVLPLQGFWNAIIYMVTSWKACKNMIHGRSQRPAVTELVGGMRGEGNDYYAESSASHFRSPRIVRSGGESESMKGLARSEHSSE